MSQRIARHLRANAVAYLALFAALTLGPAWAATKTAPKNSVKSKSIKNGQVRSVDIRDGQVTGLDVDESTLSGVPLPPCPSGELLKSTGAGYECATDIDTDTDTDTNSGGTVTSVGSGAGLTGGPITGDGALALQACPTGQLLKSNGSGYACGADLDSGGDITGVSAGPGLTGGAAAGNATVAIQSCPDGLILRSLGSDWVCNFVQRSANNFSNSTTPSVADGLTYVVLQYSSPVTVLNLGGGERGQVVTLTATNTQVTINDGGSFDLTATWNSGLHDTLTLVKFDSGSEPWVEVARSNN